MKGFTRIFVGVIAAVVLTLAGANAAYLWTSDRENSNAHLVEINRIQAQLDGAVPADGIDLSEYPHIIDYTLLPPSANERAKQDFLALRQ